MTRRDCALRALAAALLAAGLVGPAGVSARPSAAGALPGSPSAAARAQARAEPPQEFRFGEPLGLSALVGRSDMIVAGEVLDLRSSWTPDRSNIFTTVILRVDRQLKGGGGDVVRFRIPGGTVGEDWVYVTHAPRFALGERALVFLRSGGGRLPTVVGMEAGKRHLAADDDGSERILPEFYWARGAGRPEVALDTVEALAAAMPRLEALALDRRED